MTLSYSITLTHAGSWLDEVVFADGKVNLIGQVIGLIVAESQPLAQRASKLVTVTYQDLPSVITIEVCGWSGSFFSDLIAPPSILNIVRGTLSAAIT